MPNGSESTFHDPKVAYFIEQRRLATALAELMEEHGEWAAPQQDSLSSAEGTQTQVEPEVIPKALFDPTAPAVTPPDQVSSRFAQIREEHGLTGTSQPSNSAKGAVRAYTEGRRRILG